MGCSKKPENQLDAAVVSLGKANVLVGILRLSPGTESVTELMSGANAERIKCMTAVRLPFTHWRAAEKREKRSCRNSSRGEAACDEGQLARIGAVRDIPGLRPCRKEVSPGARPREAPSRCSAACQLDSIPRNAGILIPDSGRWILPSGSCRPSRAIAAEAR